MRLAVLATVAGLLAIALSEGRAAPTWCSTHPSASNMVFCDDFDRYCENPPAAPERCDPQGTDIRDSGAMWQVWDGMHNCGWVPGVHDENYSSYPYCAKIGCQPWNNELGYGNTGLGDEIRARFGTAFGQVLATDLTPLSMEFTIYGSKIRFANLYLELGSGRATQLLPAGTNCPTNWVISEDCRLCGDTFEQGFYPIICRQSPTPSGCADVSTASVLPAIAVGVLAFLDPNPCHCGQPGLHSPSASHLAFFDGRQWHTLRRGLFPDPGGAEPAPGDFLLMVGDFQHHIRLTLTGESVIVELRVGSPVVLSRCIVPRAYIGPFNSMLMGYQTPCQLIPGTWDCNGALDCNGPCGPAKTCCVSGAPGGGTVPVDDIALYGGQGFASQGACCLPAVPDYICEMTYQGDCAMMGGDFRGSGSSCDDPQMSCCPPLPPDHDVDGDVDMQDFGWFQTCMSGSLVAPPSFGCRCADFDRQGDVDQSDFAIFYGCLSGANVPADPNCMN